VRAALVRHPATPCEAVSSIEVEIERNPIWMSFKFIATGDGRRIKLPDPPLDRASERRDELWKMTCFEAFARPAGNEGYLEYNFSPFGDWAIYQFDGYREGMRHAELVADCQGMMCDGEALTVMFQAQVKDVRPLDLNIAAVIEEIDGRKSYWALKHPTGNPDFHASDCFILSLPAIDRS